MCVADVEAALRIAEHIDEEGADFRHLVPR
jgi:hypothetical protein